MFLIAPLAIAAAPAIVAGVGSLIGGDRANRARRQEAQRNRNFQERMRNTQWQAGIADMEAAGINPALAYSKGPASAPGGSMAQQQDSVSPAISSAMGMKRMTADLRLLQEQTRKAGGEAESAVAKGELDQFRTRYLKTSLNDDGSGDVIMPLMRMLNAEVEGGEMRTRKDRLQGDILGPMANLSERMGEFLPILMLLSQLSPGGILKGGSRKAGRLIAGGKARALKGRQLRFLKRSGG